MVESWMDRIARPNGLRDGEVRRSETHTEQGGAKGPAWDPYEVWYRQVKQARDRAARQSLPLPGNQRPTLHERAPESPRWRLRLSALLPRLTG